MLQAPLLQHSFTRFVWMSWCYCNGCLWFCCLSQISRTFSSHCFSLLLVWFVLFIITTTWSGYDIWIAYTMQSIVLRLLFDYLCFEYISRYEIFLSRSVILVQLMFSFYCYCRCWCSVAVLTLRFYLFYAQKLSMMRFNTNIMKCIDEIQCSQL